jgi:hypothetical protein
MEDTSFLDALVSERKALQVKIAELQDELAIVNKMISRRTGSQLQLEPTPAGKQSRVNRIEKPEPMKLTPALHYLLAKNHGDAFTAIEFRDQLIDMKERGEFTTDAKNVKALLPTIHQTLKSFVERGIIPPPRKAGGKVKYYKPVQS